MAYLTMRPALDGALFDNTNSIHVDTAKASHAGQAVASGTALALACTPGAVAVLRVSISGVSLSCLH